MEIVWFELQREKLGRLMSFLNWSKSSDQSWLNEPQNELQSFLQAQVVPVVFRVMLFNVHKAVRHVGKSGTFQNASPCGNSCQTANIHFLLAFILSEREELGIFIPLPVGTQPLWEKLIMEPKVLIHRSCLIRHTAEKPLGEGLEHPWALWGCTPCGLWPC